ncbi:MAG: hypothetical protein PHD48_06755 [Alphaproteobacteria bacterium]|nr:hypothetical protein [Alphaproteobacteria bacterium]
MIDTYLKSKNKEALESLAASVTNVMPICQGNAAQEGTDESDTYYTCVRAPFPIPAFDDVEVCSVEEGTPIIGVWA